MSVVNRMLLDIDRRHGATDVQTRGPFPDVLSVPASPAKSSRKPLTVVMVAAAAAGLAAVAVVRSGWLERAPLPVVAPSAAATKYAPVAAAPASPPAVVPELPAAGKTAAIVAAPPPAEVIEAPKRIPRPRAAHVESFKLSRQLSDLDERLAAALPPPIEAAPRASPLPALVARTAAPVRQVATDETVAVARAQWNEGARAGALATLRQALASAEPSRNPAAIAPLARELARLEIADSRAQAGLDLLRRLEGLLADDAEAWALRANAELRLALNADSARSYLAALRLRPTEGTWMLGAAISLAAGGRMDDAQAWADRASERGAVTPAIASYLQQLGIAVRR